ncbi:MAG: hypothetical protein J0M01_09765 [Dechloromonas sp.]|jgi:hypothetical protein|nr:hypothetical protein [Dechloromonas sp.]
MISHTPNSSFWHRLRANVGKAGLAAKMVGQARRHYGGSYLAIGLRFLDLYARRYSPSEMLELDLLNVSRSRDDIDQFVSKEDMIRLQRSFNPVELTNQTENKLEFEHLCAEAGLPCARTVAVVETRPRISVSLNREEIAGGDVIDALAARLPPGAYVIKPRDGALGRGVLVFSCGDTSSEHAGETLKTHLVRHGDFDSWLVQPKLVNHEDVTRISPSPALQTVRLVTYVDGNRDVRILLAGWRLADEKAEFDNFGGAGKDNVFCVIDPADGTMQKCFMKSRHPFGFGLHQVEQHPVTGLSLIGLQPPMWNDIVKLGKRAALAFLPSRCLGWDIAATSAGPVLIEANRYWDPHYEDAVEMQQVIRYLHAERTRIGS